VGETYDRLKLIEPSYGETFDWIWTDPKLGFDEWLQNDHKGYWISGKPGSGKSTLMKHVYGKLKSHSQITRQENSVYVGFFFSDRGSHMQKSFEGLLSGIIHQTLTSEPRLVDDILPLYSEHKASEKTLWTLENLMRAFTRMLEQNRIPIKLNLFLDALDECDGPPTRISDFIQSMLAKREGATEVKLCFSSRPWNTFVDRFQNCLGLKIHEHTNGDIQKYVAGRFQDSPSTARDLASGNTRLREHLTNLQLEIVKEAEGVFLWPKLVMDAIIDAHAEGATPEELTEILSNFPQDLEEFYKNILRKIPRGWQHETYAMLEIVLRSHTPLSISAFRSALAIAPCQTLKECLKKILESESVASADFDAVRRRVKSRCGGLLEVADAGVGPVVQFMHQTVKDFIIAPGFLNMISDQGYSVPEENGYSFLYKARLVEAVVLQSKDEIAPSEAAYNIYLARLYGNRAELTTGKNQRYLFDESCKAIFRNYPSGIRSNFQSDKLQLNSAFSLAVVSNLKLYVQEILDKQNIPKSILSESLLFAAVAVGSPDEYLWVDHGDVDDLSDMVKLLFRYGADKDAAYNGLTGFQRIFWKNCYEGHYLFKSNASRLTPNMINMARAYLDDKQDPDVEITSKQCKCKPLHVANVELLRLLLQYKPDVNALDESGLTPLDVCLGGERIDSRHPRHEEPDLSLESALLLIDHGACVTEPGRDAARDLANYLETVNQYATYDRLKNPPVLPTPVAYRLGHRLHSLFP
jgi:hypothetical protein